LSITKNSSQTNRVPFVWEEKPGIPLPSYDAGKLSTAIPLQQNSLSKNTCDKLYISSSPASPASSESDSSISSYETGRSSLTGSAFLECLFPLFPPKSSFLEMDIGYTEKVGSSLVELNGNDYDFELGDYTFDVSKKQPTLGELIMMSRRRSCRRKATQMNKWDPPKVTLSFLYDLLLINKLILISTFTSTNPCRKPQESKLLDVSPL
jgi:hypothetical protein